MTRRGAEFFIPVMMVTWSLFLVFSVNCAIASNASLMLAYRLILMLRHGRSQLVGQTGQVINYSL